MSTSKVVVSEVYSDAWVHFKRDWMMLSAATLVHFLINVVASWVLTPVIGGIVGMFLSALTLLGVFKLAFDSIDQKPVKVENMFRFFETKDFWKYGVISIAVTFAIGVGVLFLIVPGVYVAMRLVFWNTLVADGRVAEPFESIKSSWDATRGQVWPLVVCASLAMIIGLCGMMVAFVGIIPASAYLALVFAGISRRLVPKPFFEAQATPPQMTHLTSP
jgi:hypothetical protein